MRLRLTDRQTTLRAIDGMDVGDVTLLGVLPEGKLIVDPGLNFVDQKAASFFVLVFLLSNNEI